MAGWLVNPGENCGATDPQCEDWHYNIRLDPDFVQDFYRDTGIPLAKAVLPGNPVNPNRQLAFLDAAPDGTSRGITLNSFLLPNTDQPQSYPELIVELNGWHVSARGQPPNGWVADPAHSDTFWPYDPTNPDNRTNPDGTPDRLKSGDYVIMSGTLWQDGAHIAGWWCAQLGGLFCGATSQEALDCWNGSTGGHGGWIELHPVDAIVRVRKPEEHLRKTTAMVAVCAPQELIDTSRTRDVTITPITSRPPSSKLKFAELIDGRLTTTANVDKEVVTLIDNPNDAHLEVHVKVHSSGTPSGHGRAGSFKAVYLLWWEEEANTPRSQFLGNEDWTKGGYYGSLGTFFADVTGDGKADAIVVNNNAPVTVRVSDGGQFLGNKDWTEGGSVDREGLSLPMSRVTAKQMPSS